RFSPPRLYPPRHTVLLVLPSFPTRRSSDLRDRPVRPVRLPAGHDRRWWRQMGELLRFCRGGRQETLPGEVDTGLEPRSEGERVGVPGDPAILEGKPGEDTHHVEVVEPVVEETTGGLEVAAPLLGPEDNRVELATVT